MKKTITIAAFLWLTSVYGTPAGADTFGTATNNFDIDFITIGDPGNPDDFTGDPSPAGNVDYVYRIGQFEISEGMIDTANFLGSLALTHDNRGASKPATSITWFEAVMSDGILLVDENRRLARFNDLWLRCKLPLSLGFLH